MAQAGSGQVSARAAAGSRGAWDEAVSQSVARSAGGGSSAESPGKGSSAASVARSASRHLESLITSSQNAAPDAAQTARTISRTVNAGFRASRVRVVQSRACRCRRCGRSTWLRPTRCARRSERDSRRHDVPDRHCDRGCGCPFLNAARSLVWSLCYANPCRSMPVPAVGGRSSGCVPDWDRGAARSRVWRRKRFHIKTYLCRSPCCGL